MTANIMFDGVSYEADAALAAALAAEREDAKGSYAEMKRQYEDAMAKAEKLKAEMDAMKEEMQGKNDAAEGRADALAEQVESLQAELEAAKQINVDSIVAERIALVEKAKPVLDAEYAFAGKSDREVMVDAIKAVRGDSVALEERSDDYVLAMFDVISSEAADRTDSTKELREAVAAALVPASAPSSYMDRLQNAWKSPLSVTKEAN